MTNHFDELAETWDQDPMKIDRSRTTAEQCKKVSLHANKSLLDFGGGTGLLSLFLQDSFDSITIVDTSKEMLRVAQEKIEEAKISNIKTFVLNKDISEVPGKFSAIITLMTLHHIINVDTFLRGASNILDDHGVLMIADIYQEDGSFHKNVKDYDGHNGFEIEPLSKKLENAGFKVTEVNKYFEIKKENYSGKEHMFPLFFLVAEKQNS